MYIADKFGCQMRDGPRNGKQVRVLWKGEILSALGPSQMLLQFSSTDDYLQTQKYFKLKEVLQTVHHHKWPEAIITVKSVFYIFLTVHLELYLYNNQHSALIQ
jgi:hypothetical protein